MNIFRKILSTLAHEGLYSMFLKTYRRIKYIILRFIHYNSNDAAKWAQLKDKYKGKRVFLIGNGPSLNKMPLYLLKDEYTMCFNRFYIMVERLNWKPSFFMSVDNLVIEDLINDMSPVLNNCDYCFIPKVHYRGNIFYKRIKENPKIMWLKHYFGMDFSHDLPKIYGGGTVIIEGLQVLNYLGFDEIIMLGVDMNYKIHETVSRNNTYSADVTSNKDDDPNHFDPRYFGKGRSFHQPEKFIIDHILESLNYIGNNQSKFGTNIVNAGFDSKVECFPKKDFYSLFKFKKDDIEKIFAELLSGRAHYSSVDDFENTNVFIEKYEDVERVKESDFYAPLDLSLSIYKEMIFTHIPLGPFKNNYYFIKRTNNLN